MNGKSDFYLAFFRRLMLEAEALGYEISTAVENVCAEIEQDIIAGESAAIFDSYLRLLALLEAQQSDRYIGLHLGERIDFKQIGAYGQVLAYAGSVQEVLELATRCGILLDNASILELNDRGGAALFSSYYNGSDQLATAQADDLSLSAYVKLIQSIVGEDWRPSRVCFEHSRPSDIAEHRRIFGESLLFEQSKNCLEIQSEVLRHRNRAADPALLRTVRKYADELIFESLDSDMISQQVSAMLLASMGRGELTQNMVADRLNCSRSSLQRYLAAEGASFRRLRGQAIYKLSCSALASTDSSIKQIATMLGYSEASAFDRAFLRLSGGLTPSKYREKCRRTLSRPIAPGQSDHSLS